VLKRKVPGDSMHSLRLKPPPLRPGDTIGIVAPASNIKRGELDRGCEALRAAGYAPFFFDSILDQDLYFAGSLDRRVEELEQMFRREDIRAILCARGGYGANYLLNKIKLQKVKARPKIFIGYSDITSLLTHFADAGLITFHGPMAARDWADDAGVDAESWHSALSGSGAWDVPLNPETHGLVNGEA
jgi:muramoyltetrapeptide carboxypeptidase